MVIGNYVLSEKRLKEYEAKIEKSDKVEVYRLIANSTGLYPCYRCHKISYLKLNN